MLSTAGSIPLQVLYSNVCDMYKHACLLSGYRVQMMLESYICIFYLARRLLKQVVEIRWWLSACSEVQSHIANIGVSSPEGAYMSFGDVA
mgnify:FL=1